jgi:hypothetical protein
LADLLWSKGLYAGIYDAVADVHYILDTTDVEVEVTEFSLSEPPDGFDQAELQQLGLELRALTYAIVSDALAGRATR